MVCEYEKAIMYDDGISGHPQQCVHACIPFHQQLESECKDYCPELFDCLEMNPLKQTREKSTAVSPLVIAIAITISWILVVVVLCFVWKKRLISWIRNAPLRNQLGTLESGNPGPSLLVLGVPEETVALNQAPSDEDSDTPIHGHRSEAGGGDGASRDETIPKLANGPSDRALLFSESEREFILESAKKDGQIVNLSFTKQSLDIHFRGNRSLDEAELYYCNLFKLNAHQSGSLYLLKIRTSTYIPFNPQPPTLSIQPLKVLQSQRCSHINIGAFVHVAGVPHILTVTHGQLAEGEEANNPPITIGTCQISTMRHKSLLCDASLIRMEHGASQLHPCSNIIEIRNGPSVQSQDLSLYDGDYEDLLNQNCIMHSEEAKRGTISSVDFYHLENEILGAIALSGMNSVPGDSGRVVAVETPGQASNICTVKGFGLVTGGLEIYGETRNGQVHSQVTLLVPLQRIQECFRQRNINIYIDKAFGPDILLRGHAGYSQLVSDSHERLNQDSLSNSSDNQPLSILSHPTVDTTQSNTERHSTTSGKKYFLDSPPSSRRVKPLEPEIP